MYLSLSSNMWGVGLSVGFCQISMSLGGRTQSTRARMVSSTAKAVEFTVLTHNSETVANWDTITQVDDLLSD